MPSFDFLFSTVMTKLKLFHMLKGKCTMLDKLSRENADDCCLVQVINDTLLETHLLPWIGEPESPWWHPLSWIGKRNNQECLMPQWLQWPLPFTFLSFGQLSSLATIVLSQPLTRFNLLRVFFCYLL